MDDATPTSKRCSKCGEIKPLAEFYAHKGHSSGRANRCKPCYRANVKVYRDTNRDRINAGQRARYAADNTRWLAKKERFKQAHPNVRQGYRLKAFYGMTVEQYTAMFDQQNGVCTICGEPPNGKPPNGHRLHVDHDHETGAMRGLLCTDCNLGLGKFGDDPERLRKAADYLERHGR